MSQVLLNYDYPNVPSGNSKGSLTFKSFGRGRAASGFLTVEEGSTIVQSYPVIHIPVLRASEITPIKELYWRYHLYWNRDTPNGVESIHQWNVVKTTGGYPLYPNYEYGTCAMAVFTTNIVENAYINIGADSYKIFEEAQVYSCKGDAYKITENMTQTQAMNAAGDFLGRFTTTGKHYLSDHANFDTGGGYLIMFVWFKHFDPAGQGTSNPSIDISIGSDNVFNQQEKVSITRRLTMERVLSSAVSITPKFFITSGGDVAGKDISFEVSSMKGGEKINLRECTFEEAVKNLGAIEVLYPHYAQNSKVTKQIQTNQDVFKGLTSYDVVRLESLDNTNSFGVYLRGAINPNKVYRQSVQIASLDGSDLSGNWMYIGHGSQSGNSSFHKLEGSGTISGVCAMWVEPTSTTPLLVYMTYGSSADRFRCFNWMYEEIGDINRNYLDLYPWTVSGRSATIGMNISNNILEDVESKSGYQISFETFGCDGVNRLGLIGSDFFEPNKTYEISFDILVYPYEDDTLSGEMIIGTNAAPNANTPGGFRISFNSTNFTGNWVTINHEFEAKSNLMENSTLNHRMVWYLPLNYDGKGLKLRNIVIKEKGGSIVSPLSAQVNASFSDSMVEDVVFEMVENVD